MDDKSMVWNLLQVAKEHPDFMPTTQEAIDRAREFLNREPTQSDCSSCELLQMGQFMPSEIPEDFKQTLNEVISSRELTWVTDQYLK